jgi:hypothetical protein
MVSSFVAEFARRLQGQSSALALPLTWIEQQLSGTGLTIAQFVTEENKQQAADQASVSNSIGSLRFLVAQDWREFDEIELAGLPFQVIAAPGHAPDAVALFQPEQRLLICADALLENGDCGILNTAVHGPHILDEAIATLEKFAQLDAAIALPGHGNIITDVPGSIALLQRRLASFQEEPARMAWHLLRRVFMTYLMMVQPICRHDLMAHALQAPWLQDYAPQCSLDPEPLAQQILDEFIQRHLAREEEGLLVSLVRR